MTTANGRWLADMAQRLGVNDDREEGTALTGDVRDVSRALLERRSNRQYEDTFGDWLRGPIGTGKRAHGLSHVTIGARVERALGVGTSVSAGYLVPAAFEAQVFEAIDNISPMRSVATIRPTATGADMFQPTDDDTAQEGELVSEHSQVTSQDPSIGRNVLPTYAYSSKEVRVSFQLLEDAGPEFETWLAGVLGRRVGRILNRHATIGTGGNMPRGIVTRTTASITGNAGQTSSFIYAQIIALQDSVNSAYRFQPSTGYLMHSDTFAFCKTLSDANNRPLVMRDTAGDGKWYIDSYPVVINDHMPTMAANAKSVIFGDLSRYVVRDVQGAGMIRLDEPYAELLQVAFVYFARFGGDLLDTNAVTAFQHSAS